MKIHFADVKIFGTYVEDEDKENKNKFFTTCKILIQITSVIVV